VNGFTADSLRLREPVDAAARAAELAASFARPVETRLRVIDLASGTGANMRYLAPRLGGAQEWLLIDHDPALLAAAGGTARTLTLDLARSLETLPLEECDLVTASALLDLVSARWLERLAARCAAARVGVLFALTYDGRIEWSPSDPGDERVRSLVNRHQRTDKGFGPALGPNAAAAAAERFSELGYEVRTARSDWDLGPSDAALQLALLADWTRAAAEVAPEEKASLQDWAGRRRALLAIGRSRLRVGHVDIAGWLAGGPGAAHSVRRSA
jgi:hypothetical protein